MLKKTLITLLSIMTLTLNSQTSVDNSIHQFKVADIYGNIFDFSQLKGKKVMIVNTASKCGLTYQYEALQKLYSQYKDLNFVIVGFPSNDFLWQEPGSNDEIIDFYNREEFENEEVVFDVYKGGQLISRMIGKPRKDNIFYFKNLNFNNFFNFL